MLGALESRLTAKVADALNGRGAIVVSAPLPVVAPAAGQRVVRVSVDGVAAGAAFEPERSMFTGQAPDQRSRRVIHVTFTAKVRAIAQPSALEAQPAADARRLLMEDLSLVLHALDAAPFRTGDDLDASGDPGYDVLGFALAGGTVRPELVDGAVVGELEYRGAVRLWPPGVSEEGTTIRGVETVVESLPIEITPLQGSVRTGERTTIRVNVLSRSRGAGAARVPARLAVTVLGDAPPAERGTLAGGAASSLAGFTTFVVDKGVARIEYVAPPSGLMRPRTEHVAVHLATPEGAPGLLLGSSAIRVVPAVP
ncbi:MAG: hypothetical protein QM736_22535 [Vicinamibacterales bacterium]